jgi:hypothetical protein
MGTGSFSVVESGRDVMLTPQPHPVPRSKKQSSAIILLSLRAFVVCKRVKPTYKIITVVYIECIWPSMDVFLFLFGVVGKI